MFIKVHDIITIKECPIDHMFIIDRIPLSEYYRPNQYTLRRNGIRTVFSYAFCLTNTALNKLNDITFNYV